MFSRRLLRIKVLQTLYAFHKVEGKTYTGAEAELKHSIEKTYELYYLLLQLPVALVDYAAERIEQARRKRIPSQEDIHPNTRFIDLQMVRQLNENKSIRKFTTKHHLDWAAYPEIIRNLFKLLIETPYYQDFMVSDDASYAAEKQLMNLFYLDLVMNFEELYLNLEEQSIYWINDVDFVIQMIVKTLKKFKPDEEGGGTPMPMFKDADDLKYAIKLLRKSILHEKDALALIKQTANNWELDRIAFTDNLILQLAITEGMEFPSIPTKVTINEYIEIAKDYSTQKSSQFINGILDKVFAGLKNEGKIIKTGRGLIGE